jgi:hypothetical protein
VVLLGWVSFKSVLQLVLGKVLLGLLWQLAVAGVLVQLVPVHCVVGGAGAVAYIVGSLLCLL